MSTEKKSIYFMGIGGTGMAATAGLCLEDGHEVSGSDNPIYPPMSDLIQDLGIPVKTPYSSANIKNIKPDLVVVANALSRGHEELEEAISRKLKLTSFPELINQLFLDKRDSIVVAGTHGKTTTSSYISYVLDEIGHNPCYFIGGIPKNFPRSFRLTDGNLFVLEGDEYDTAYFDKAPKFLHYKPTWAIINNIEFDHADIYKNIEEIKERFKQLMTMTPNPKQIIVNIDDQNINRCLEELGIKEKVTTTSTKYKSSNRAQIQLLEHSASPKKWTARFSTQNLGKIQLETQLFGMHNISNLAQVLALVDQLHEGKPSANIPLIAEAFASFKGVTRRLEVVGESNNVTIYEDFAHHPTAVKTVIDGFRKSEPNRRLLVAFEPKNATSRRNIFLEEYAKSFAHADLVYIGACPKDIRIAEEDRMETSKLAERLGEKGKSFETNELLLDKISQDARPGDAVIFMSSGSFSGIQHKLSEKLSKA